MIFVIFTLTCYFHFDLLLCFVLLFLLRPVIVLLKYVIVSYCCFCFDLLLFYLNILLCFVLLSSLLLLLCFLLLFLFRPVIVLFEYIIVFRVVIFASTYCCFLFEFCLFFELVLLFY